MGRKRRTCGPCHDVLVTGIYSGNLSWKDMKTRLIYRDHGKGESDISHFKYYNLRLSMVSWKHTENFMSIFEEMLTLHGSDFTHECLFNFWDALRKRLTYNDLLKR